MVMKYAENEFAFVGMQATRNVLQVQKVEKPNSGKPSNFIFHVVFFLRGEFSLVLCRFEEPEDFWWRGCTGDDQTLLSKFESLLDEKSEEVALWSQNSIPIYLIGMMASGKSTIGREVAKALKYKFYDRSSGSVIGHLYFCST
jgi:hypothetical protein